MSKPTPCSIKSATDPRVLPVRRALPNLIREPLNALLGFGTQANGDIVRLNLGTFRPYLVTHPAHVQHMLRDNSANYERAGDGLFWKPIRRLFGEGILGEGRIWSASRKMLQPLFTAKRVEALVDRMAEEIGAAVAELDDSSRLGRSIDLKHTLSTIVCRTMMKVLFADKISLPDAMRVVNAQDAIATAVLPRILVPFAPLALPMPGDRTFREAVRTVDEVIVPIIRRHRSQPDDNGDDIISTLCRARTEDGQLLDEQQIRNDTVAMFAATTETTINLLTWLWPHLNARPDVADRLRTEINQVVGTNQVRREHLPELTYTKMVLDELLRLYPIGWLIPRRAVGADAVGGVRIEAGATIVISPLVTQRLERFWERPHHFDPDRFTPDKVRQRHRYAHFPFGGGPHQCLGMYLFYLEAQLIVATVLSRFQFRMNTPKIPTPRIAASLRPRDQVNMTLLPVQRAA